MPASINENRKTKKAQTQLETGSGPRSGSLPAAARRRVVDLHHAVASSDPPPASADRSLADATQPDPTPYGSRSLNTCTSWPDLPHIELTPHPSTGSPHPPCGAMVERGRHSRATTTWIQPGSGRLSLPAVATGRGRGRRRATCRRALRARESPRDRSRGGAPPAAVLRAREGEGGVAPLATVLRACEREAEGGVMCRVCRRGTR